MRRVEFAKHWLQQEAKDPGLFRTFAFSDESYFCCGDTRHWHWCEEDEPPTAITREKYTAKCHKFAVITFDGYRTARLPASGEGSGASGGCNSKDFLAALKKIDGLREFLDDKKLILDGASIHNSRETQEWLAKQRFELICGGREKTVQAWPPHSPDLNPIENWWALLKKHVGAGECAVITGNTPAVRDTLHEAIKDAAKETPKEHFENLIDSFKTRLERCIATNGKWIGY